MVYACNFDRSATHAIGDDIRRAGDDEFARAGNTSWSPKFRILRKEVLYAAEDVHGDALCGGWIRRCTGAGRGGRGSIRETIGASYTPRSGTLFACLP